jgi:hypothetical protein
MSGTCIFVDMVWQGQGATGTTDYFNEAGNCETHTFLQPLGNIGLAVKMDRSAFSRGID